MEPLDKWPVVERKEKHDGIIKIEVKTTGNKLLDTVNLVLKSLDGISYRESVNILNFVKTQFEIESSEEQ